MTIFQKLRKLFKTQDETTNDHLAEQEIDKVLAEYREHLIRIDNLLPSTHDLSWKLFKMVIRRFLRKVWDIPASEKHHHRERFGLFIHSLETVAGSLYEQHKRLDLKLDVNGNLDSQYNIRNKARILFRTAIQALLHDAGKIFDVKITCNNLEFDIINNNLLDFAIQNPGYKITWKKNRHNAHIRRNFMVFMDVVSDADRAFIGQENLLIMVDYFMEYNPKETLKACMDIIQESNLVKSADIKSTTEYLAKSMNIHEPNDEEKLVTAFEKAFSDIFHKQGFTMNIKGADIFVMDSHTLFLSPATLNKVIETMIKNYNMKTTRINLVAVLAKAGYLMETTDKRNFLEARLKYSDDDDSDNKLSVVAVKNKYLYLVKPDNFKGEISLTNVDMSTQAQQDPEKEETEKQTLSHIKEQIAPTAEQIEQPQDNETSCANQDVESQQHEATENNDTEATEDTNQPVPIHPETCHTPDDIKAESYLLSYYERLEAFKSGHDVKKYQVFLKALNLTIESGRKVENIFPFAIHKLGYIAVVIPDGFIEIANITGLFDTDSENLQTIIHGYVNSLHDSGCVGKFGNKSICSITSPSGKFIEKCIMVLPEKINEFSEED